MAKSMTNRSPFDQGLWLVTVGLAAWAVPGAGHFLINERKRGILIFCCLTGLFVTGLYVGSVGVINRVASWPWFLAQILYSPAVGILDKIVQTSHLESFGRPCDVGQIYTGIAGLLNLLCILSAVYMAYCGRGELIGTEEEPNA